MKRGPSGNDAAVCQMNAWMQATLQVERKREAPFDEWGTVWLAESDVRQRVGPATFGRWVGYFLARLLRGHS